jgi:hypothetical protein
VVTAACTAPFFGDMTKKAAVAVRKPELEDYRPPAAAVIEVLATRRH